MDELLEAIDEADNSDVDFDNDEQVDVELDGGLTNNTLYATAVADQSWMFDDDSMADTSSSKLNLTATSSNAQQISISQDGHRRISQIRRMMSEAAIDFTAPTSVSKTKITVSEVHRKTDSDIFIGSDDEDLIVSSNLKNRHSHCIDAKSSKTFSSTKCEVSGSVDQIRKKSLVISGETGVTNTAVLSAFFDSFFRIRVSTPKISSSTFQGYVGNRQKVRLAEIERQVGTIQWDDWVTMAVVALCSPKQKSVNGNDYLIMTLTDLLDCNKIVKMFLFGTDSIDSWAKVSSGTVLAFLNAAQMPYQNPKYKKDITLKIDNAQKILEIGHSPDFAYCKSKRKSDGRHCTNIVNKSSSDVCDYHVISSAKHIVSKRGEFHLSSNVSLKSYDKRNDNANNNNNNKAQNGFNDEPRNLYTVAAPLKGNVSFVNSQNTTLKKKSHSSISSKSLLQRVSIQNLKTPIQPPNNLQPSIATTLKKSTTLSDRCQRPTNTNKKITSESKSDVETPSTSSDVAFTNSSNQTRSNDQLDTFANLLNLPSTGSSQLLGQLVKNANDRNKPTIKNSLKSDQKKIDSLIPSSFPKLTLKQTSTKITCQQFLAQHKQTDSEAAARAKAILILKNKQQKELQVRANDNAELIVDGYPQSKRARLGDINLSIDDMKRLTSVRSKFEDELDKDEVVRQEAYFKLMESKEKVERRASEIKELSSKVVTCKVCDYTWHAQSSLCLKLRHTVHWHQALRKFFKCKNCSTKTISYSKYPTKPCENCSGTTYERTTMREEKKFTRMPDLELKVRGSEESHL